MNQVRLFTELSALAEQLGIEVREEDGDFTSGYCRLDLSGKEPASRITAENDGFALDKLILLNKKDSLPRKNRVIALAVLQEEYEQLFILPAVREFLEKCIDISFKT